MNRAVRFASAFCSSSTSVCQVSVSSTWATVAPRFGVIDTVAVVPPASKLGYADGDAFSSWYGDGDLSSVGCVSAIVAVPTEASETFDDVVAALTQNVPRSMLPVAS